MWRTALQQVVDAFLSPHHADVADQVAAAALERCGCGGTIFMRSRLGPLRTTNTRSGVHAAALDGDAPVGLVGGDRHVGGAEGPALQR